MSAGKCVGKSVGSARVVGKVLKLLGKGVESTRVLGECSEC